MTQEDIIAMFRQHAAAMPGEEPELNAIINGLASLLAESRGRFSKEHFEALVGFGGMLYRKGHAQFHGKNDVDDIMHASLRNRGGEDGSIKP